MKKLSNQKLFDLKEKEKQYKEKLTVKRLSLGKADGAMESQCPSGRFELESDIKILELMLAGIRQEIIKLHSTPTD